MDKASDEKTDNVNDNKREKMVNTRIARVKTDKSLFNSYGIDGISKNYDMYSTKDIKNDSLLLSSPALLAHRNHSKITKSSMGRSPMISIKKPNILGSSAFFPKKKVESGVKQAFSLAVVQRELELEKQTLMFDDDPLAYFSKHKDGGGHKFIYLVRARDSDDPMFSPYELVKVPHAQIGREYFTMSATGVTHIHSDGDTESFTLDQWAKETIIYQGLRKLRFFSHYSFWKSIKLWKLFLIKQRYSSLMSRVNSHTLFINRNFFGYQSQVHLIQNDIIRLLKQHMLCFIPGRKYRMEEFVQQNKENSEELTEKYEAFIDQIERGILNLYSDISDPQKVAVTDDELPDSKMRNPNIRQLISLEKKKAIFRVERTNQANSQIWSLGNYIRSIDYMILETLARGVLECYRIADHNVSQKGSSIFKIEVSFDDAGNVVFEPDIHNLEAAVIDSFKFSMKTLSNLPRILKRHNLRSLVYNSGLSIEDLIEKGPILSDFTDPIKELPEIEENILKMVRDSYNDALIFAQTFSDFYPIHKLGQTWNIRNYVKTRKGDPYMGPLSDRQKSQCDDDFLVNTHDEPVINFISVENDIKAFQEDDKRVIALRQGAVKGALHVDSRTLRTALLPIPRRALSELHNLMVDLTTMKTELITNALSYYTKMLKQEPNDLESFVQLCSIIRRTIHVKPAIEAEINFIDQTYSLFDKFGFSHDRNQLQPKFSTFISDQNAAINVRKQNITVYTIFLKDIVTQLENDLSQYHEKASSVPATISSVDNENAVKKAERLLEKVLAMESKVEQAVKFQEEMEVELNKFAFYKNVLNVSTFARDLYICVDQWFRIWEDVSKVPFNQINIESFKDSTLKLLDNISKLQSLPSAGNYPILAEVNTKVNELLPYIDSLVKLSKGRLQGRHWNILFESSEQASYSHDMTTEYILKSNILKNTEMIEQVTNMSQCEYELENEFRSISNYWNKVQLPIVDKGGVLNEGNLLLASTNNLMTDISDALLNLSRMLSLPHVQGIRENILSLIGTLENISRIIESWQLFQSNWVVLSVIFGQEQNKSLLEQQASIFTSVQRKWSAIARHTLKDIRLFSVCSFPSLLEVLRDNNSSMEGIISSLSKLLETKRNSFPRLFFLGNDDVLKLVGATSTEDINLPISRLFMSVDYIEFGTDTGELPNSLRESKIVALKTHDGNNLHLNEAFEIGESIESWLPKLVETVHETVKTKINDSLTIFNALSIDDWIKNYDPYIATIAIHIIATSELQKSFLPVDYSSSDFDMTKIMSERITKIIGCLNLNHQITNILSLLIMYRDKSQYMKERIENHADYNPAVELDSMILFFQRGQSIHVQVGDHRWEFGYEFWGRSPFLVRTRQIDAAYNALARSLKDLSPPLMTGSASTGKASLVKQLASDFGRYIYIWNSFPDINEYFLYRILNGCCATGSWALISHIEKYSHKHMCYIYDNIRNIYNLLGNSVDKVTIANKVVELNLNTRIFLTSNASGWSSHDFLPQLKSIIRPISIPRPCVVSIAKMKLLSLNFQNYEEISIKLVNVIENAVTLYKSPPYRNSITHTALVIVKEARRILNFGYSDEFYSIYAATVRLFSVDGGQLEISCIAKLIYSAFKPTHSFEEFMDKLRQMHESTQRLRKIELFANVSMKIGSHLPHQYLAVRALHLYDLLLFNKACILAGPPLSGKTILTTILEVATNGPEFRKEFPDLPCVTFVDSYFGSETDERLFGHVCDDPTSGQSWAYGMLQSIIYHLQQRSNNFLIIRFDGVLSERFSQFLSAFLNEYDSPTVTLSSQDVYNVQKRLKVIVETPTIQYVTPELMCKVGFCTLSNKSLENIPFGVSVTCNIEDPELIYKQAIYECDIPEDIQSETMKNLFISSIHLIVKKIFTMKNFILYSHESERMVDGRYYICVTLAIQSIQYAYGIIHNIDARNDEEVRLALIYSYNRIYQDILDSSEHDNFSAFLCETFNINVPKEWIGHNVPDLFWQLYPKPSLTSLCFSDSELVPLDFNLISEPPTFAFRGGGVMPIFCDEILLTHPQMLAPLMKAKLYLSRKQNFILHGENGSGKTSFLNRLFAQDGKFFPIFMQSSKFSSAEQAIYFIIQHTPLLSKSIPPSVQGKTVVLVVRDLDSSHKKLIEFIRMINEKKKIVTFSTADPKVYESLQLHPFVTVITTSKISNLDYRFVSKFNSVRLAPISMESSMFIFKNILEIYGFTHGHSSNLVRIAASLLNQFPTVDKSKYIMEALYPLCHFEDKLNIKSCITVVLQSLYFRVLHHFPFSELSNKLDYIVKNECKTEEDQEAIKEFVNLNTLYYLDSDLSKDTKNLKVTLTSFEYTKVVDLIYRELALYNANSSEKVSLHVTPMVCRDWLFIKHAFKCPGINIALCGSNGSGKYTMCRVLSHICEYDFVNVASPTPEELLSSGDRLYSLFSVLRDVISNAVLHQKRSIIFVKHTPDTLPEVRTLVDFAKSNDFTMFFIGNSLEDLYSRFMNNNNLTIEHRATALRQIKQIIRVNIHVVIATSSFELNEFPYTSFTRIELNNDSKDLFIQLALESVEQPATKKLVGTMSQKLSNAIGNISDIAKNYIPYFHPNMVYDFIESFSHFAAADLQDLITKNDKIQSSLSFISKLEIEGKAIERKMESLVPTIQKLQVDGESLQSSYSTKKDVVDSRRQKLLDDKKRKVTEIESMKNELEVLKKRKEDILPMLSKHLANVNALSKNDIEAVRISANDPLPSMKLLMDILCLLMELSPSYEQCGQNLLMDQDFINLLTSKIGHESIRKNVLDDILPYFDNEQLSLTELEAIAPALVTLYNWVRGLCDYGVIDDKISTMSTCLIEKEEALQKYMEEMERELNSIEQVSNNLENELKSIEDSKASREKMERDYKAVDDKKTFLDSLYSDIRQFHGKWQHEAKEFQSKRDKLIGNSALFSFYLVFGGSLQNELLHDVLEKVADELRSNCIDSDSSTIFKQIQDRFIPLKPSLYYGRPDTIDNIDLSLQIHNSLTTLRTPLIIDPDGLAHDILKREFKQRILVMSIYCSCFDQIAARAVSEGKVLVVIDVMSLSPVVASLMALDTILQDQHMNKEVRVGSKLVTWDPNFKMILISPSPDIKRLPMDLLSRVNVINCDNSSIKAIESIISHSFMLYFHSDLTSKVMEARRQEIERMVQLYKYENSILDTIADIVATQAANPNYDYISDNETMEELMTSKELYKKAQQIKVDNQIIQEYKYTQKQFRDFVKDIHIHWKVISRIIPSVDQSIAFSFQNYLSSISSIFVNENYGTGYIPGEQHAELKASINNTSLKMIMPSLDSQSMIFFLFMVSFFAKHGDDQYSMDDLEAILKNISNSSNCKLSYKLPEDLNADLLEKLKNAPSTHLFDCFTSFISEHFGPDILNYTNEFSADKIITNSSTIPSVITYPPSISPSFMVHQLVESILHSNNYESLSLSEDLDMIRSIKKVVSTATSKGSWIILHISKPFAAMRQFVSDIIMNITTTSIDTNFRLIVLCSCPEVLTPSLLKQAKRTVIDRIPNLRLSMQSYFATNSAHTIQSKNRRMSKRLLYTLSGVCSFVSFRSIVAPVGFVLPVTITDSIFYHLSKYLKKIIDSHPDDLRIPFDNIRIHLIDCIFSAVSDFTDRKVLEYFVNEMITDRVLNDGCPLVRNVDPATWIIPIDVSLEQYLSQILKIPPFPTPEVFGMDRIFMPIRNYFLSKIMSKHFIVFSGLVERGSISQIYSKLKEIKALLPKESSVPDYSSLDKMFADVFITELTMINQALFQIRSSILASAKKLKENIVDDISTDLYNNITPKSWRNMLNIHTIVTPESYIKHIKDAQLHINEWISDGFKQNVHINLLTNPCGFLRAFKVFLAIENGIIEENIHLKFEFLDKAEVTKEKCIYLMGCHLFLASSKAGVVTKPSEEQSSPFFPVPVVKVSLGKYERETIRLRMCVEARLENTETESVMLEGVNSNFITHIDHPSSEAQKFFDVNSSALYCRIHEHLIE